MLTATDGRMDGNTEAARPAVDGNFYRRLVASTRRRLGLDDAEDVVQDAYLRLITSHQRDPVREPAAFLRTVTTNLLRDRARAAFTRNAVSGEMPSDATSVQPDPSTVYSDKQQLLILENALMELSPKCRATVILKRIDELSHAEIAERLGISVSMVEKHLRRALDHCRCRLSEANGDR